ncbi:uncharacterized protein BDCG_17565 [Blastomyces dermatitidis ER-3]|uniref:Uncharacterized protein n=1 Tax=Ajellomyces dermatitidis (strain ER-3 / ATCC MYA-2586) TaxID=559297 RepID=A0ABX2VZ96_AJEDR|nr:uncharacterized protein BDCG_17565 [Blastomyces dermatitidis ER-3]OAT02450.1 hypothetical protein BDCG_17565 [Blastomyces dermatitidis ER-3]
MSRMSSDDMISMIFNDLIVFCDRMSTCQVAISAADDFKSEICEYQKNVQKAMNIKAVITFDDNNYKI